MTPRAGRTWRPQGSHSRVHSRGAQVRWEQTATPLLRGHLVPPGAARERGRGSPRAPGCCRGRSVAQIWNWPRELSPHHLLLALEPSEPEFETQTRTSHRLPRGQDDPGSRLGQRHGRGSKPPAHCSRTTTPAARFSRPPGSDPLAPPRVHLCSQSGASDVRRTGSRAFLLPGRNPPSQPAATRAHSASCAQNPLPELLETYTPSARLGKTLLPCPTSLLLCPTSCVQCLSVRKIKLGSRNPGREPRDSPYEGFWRHSDFPHSQEVAGAFR